MSEAVDNVLQDLDASAIEAESGKVAVKALDTIQKQNQGLFSLISEMFKGRSSVAKGEEEDEGSARMLKGWVCKGAKCGHVMEMGDAHPLYGLPEGDERFDAAVKGEKCSRCGGEVEPLFDDNKEEDEGEGEMEEEEESEDLEKGDTLSDLREYIPTLTSAIIALNDRLAAIDGAIEVMAKGIDDVRSRVDEFDGMSETIEDLVKGLTNAEHAPSAMDSAMHAAQANLFDDEMSKGSGNDDRLTQLEVARAIEKGIFDTIGAQEYMAMGRYRGMTTEDIRKQL